MKSSKDIKKVINYLHTLEDTNESKVYEEGLIEALEWVIGERDDEDFDYSLENIEDYE